MRLATCIATELCCAAALCAGCVAGLWIGANAAINSIAQREAVAAPTMAQLPTSIAIVPRPLEPVAAPVIEQRKGPPSIFADDDEVLLAPLRKSDVVGVKINHGGTSLSLRLEFASGAKAAFKPSQVHYQSNPKKEIAAYRIDRLLGIGRVPPAFSAGFPVESIVAAAPAGARGIVAARLRDEATAQKGMLYGELSWWVPELKNAMIEGWRVDENDGIDAWRNMLRPTKPVPEDHASFVAQISTMIVFDFVIDNADRWTGSNTKSSVDGSQLYFMDNTLSLTSFSKGHTKNYTYLQRVGRFSKSLYARLKSLNEADLTAAMTPRDEDDKLGELMSAAEITALLSRRDHALRWIDSLIEKYGEDKVLAFP